MKKGKTKGNRKSKRESNANRWNQRPQLSTRSKYSIEATWRIIGLEFCKQYRPPPASTPVHGKKGTSVKPPLQLLFPFYNLPSESLLKNTYRDHNDKN
jgi:hypothetical protein